MTIQPVNRLLVILAATAGLAGLAAAKPWWLRGVESNDSDFLPPDVAFQVSARLDGDAVRVRWSIADGYYLYRQKMRIQAASPDLTLSNPAFPAGKLKSDPYLGTQEIYVQQVEARVPYTRIDGGAHPIELQVTYQGCAEAGLCYPAITKTVFPTVSASPSPAPDHPWQRIAILGGGGAFLLAGLLLKKGRRLDLPAT